MGAFERDVQRRAELEANLGAVRARIEAASRAAGRQDSPVLIVVTKFHPVEDLMTLAELGVCDVGENREQECTEKVAYLAGHRPDVLNTLNLHFIGQLQSKKAARVGVTVDVVHSLDREKLIAPLQRAGHERGRSIDVLLQVDLEENSQGRGGARPEDLAALGQRVEQASELNLRGLMAVAPRGEAPGDAFDRLGRVRERFLSEYPNATMLSAGMSGDLEEAVNIGATHLRVGTAILGSRPPAG